MICHTRLKDSSISCRAKNLFQRMEAKIYLHGGGNAHNLCRRHRRHCLWQHVDQGRSETSFVPILANPPEFSCSTTAAAIAAALARAALATSSSSSSSSAREMASSFSSSSYSFSFGIPCESSSHVAMWRFPATLCENTMTT